MSDGSPPPEGRRPTEWLRWFLNADHGAVVFAREVAATVLLFSIVGLVLFAASGIWPPLVAVESPSMEPHVNEGDLVFVVEEHRFAADRATADTGVVTYRTAAELGEHRAFGTYGDVIVFDAAGDGGTPIIHRARFWVEDGENWYDRANPRFVSGRSCAEVPNCPAPHAGFVTKGDANPEYDQVRGISGPVKPSWVRGRAVARAPWLGRVRLAVE